MWNPTYPQGVLPAAAQAEDGRFQAPYIHPGLLQQHQNGLATGLSDILAGVTSAMQKREQDEIANQLLAADNAPKAVAVNPATGLDDPSIQADPSKYSPDPALTSAMAQWNASHGFPTTSSGNVPNYGGVDALKMHDIIAKQNQAQQSVQMETQLDDLKKKQIQAEIEKLNRSNVPTPPTAAPITYTDATGIKYQLRNGQWFPIANSAQPNPAKDPSYLADQAQYKTDMSGYSKSYGNLTKAAAPYGLQPEDFNGPLDAQVVDPHTAAVLQPTDLADPDISKAAVVTGWTPTGKYIDKIPYSTYQKLTGEAAALPSKPTAPTPPLTPAAAYQNALGGNSTAAAPVRVNTPQEAAALAPGTQFITPDGRLKVVPLQ